MYMIVDRVGNGYRLYVLEDLNDWIDVKVRASITGAFGFPGENDNGRRVVDFCAESELCVGNIYFKHRSLHKYTRVARGQDEMDMKSMIDLMLVKRDMRRYVQDVRVVRGMGRGLSDHHVVLCKFRLVGASIKRRDVIEARRIRTEKLGKYQYKE